MPCDRAWVDGFCIWEKWRGSKGNQPLRTGVAEKKRREHKREAE